MQHLLLLLISLALLFVSNVSFAADYSVDASSYNWLSSRDYSEGNLVDDNPATTWAEGGSGAGEGEWVSFEFTGSLALARIGVRNGDQREGSWKSCNRVNEVLVELSDGRLIETSLKDQKGLQYIDVNLDKVTRLRLTIKSVHKAENYWNRSVTCISDLIFEAYRIDAETDKTATASHNVVSTPKPENELAKPVAKPEPKQQAREVKLARVVLSEPPAPEDAPVAKPEPVRQVRVVKLARVVLPDMETVEPATKVAPPAQPVKLARVVLPSSDPEGDALDVVRQYYLRLNTLDKTFPDLMAAKVYEQELLSFFYFEEIQRQLGTESKLHNAEVDLSQLTFELAKLTAATVQVNATGTYTVLTPGQRITLDENARFSLVMENFQWKILKKVDD